MRMTADKPEGNLYILLNYAYAEGGETYLRYAGGRSSVKLAEYIEAEAHTRGCKEVTAEDVRSGDECLECEDCPLAVLNAVATQAAELRARLMAFEDIGLSPQELAKAAALAKNAEGGEPEAQAEEGGV